ncbi:hypothetical protein H6F77_09945 [Microcoleus sp. FACHB-831]|nr:hypothetical protein [Microcoleus sp. FACHB-831]
MDTYEDKFKVALDVWKEAQVQQRTFNDLLFRIRNIAFVFAGVAVGGVGTLISKDTGLSVPGYLLIFASIPWVSLYLLDRYYYHLLLMAAVRVSEEIEAKFFSQHNIPPLSQYITKFNRDKPIPIPFINAKTGREKVTFFYALPLMTSLGVGFYFIYKNLFASVLVSLAVGGVLLFLEKSSYKKNDD